MREPIVISAAEVFCPIGLNTLQASTSVLGGISRVEASSMLDDRFEPITMGLVPEDVLPTLNKDIADSVTPQEARLLRLLSPCLQNLKAVGMPLEEMPMLLTAQSADRSAAPPTANTFFSHLGAQSGIWFRYRESRLFPEGRAGLFSAIKEAAALIASGRVPHLLVGGVDTLFNKAELVKFFAEKRILREGVLDGFTPGEGAALMVLSHPLAARRRFEDPLAAIAGVGRGEEMGHRYSDQPYLGEGLSHALFNMWEDIPSPPAPIKTIFAGFNGESFSAKEWGVATIRHKKRFEDALQMEHPAEYFGDARAALAPIMMAIGAYGLRQQMWDGPLLVWASSDDAPRGAALLTHVNP